MCLQDVHIGRRTHGQIENVAVTTTPVMGIGPDKMRRVLIISHDSATDFYISFKGDDNTVPALLIPKETQPLVLTVDFHGDIVTRGLWFFTKAGACTAGVYAAAFHAEHEVRAGG